MTARFVHVVTDANVLINLMHVSRLGLLGRLPGHEFVVPDHVREEITDADQLVLERHRFKMTFGSFRERT